MSRGNKRFYQEPVECVVTGRGQRERSQIDLDVPEREQTVILLQFASQLRCDLHIGAPCASYQTLVELSARHTDWTSTAGLCGWSTIPANVRRQHRHRGRRDARNATGLA